ncbi:MAG: ABC transporter substrate-binding protein, partial [Janthinobacterium lividum]
MTISRRLLLGAATASALPLVGRAQTEAKTLRIGVMNDQSGPYRDDGGPTGVSCVKQAVQEMAATLGFNVEVLTADHQNKPDIGA